jgi:DNA-binding MarR family transcriptional regulator
MKIREDKIFSLSRALVLSTIVKFPNKNISFLIEKTGFTRTSLYNHLNQLEERKLIISEKKKNDPGQPVIYYVPTLKADSISYKLFMKFKDLFPSLFK